MSMTRALETRSQPVSPAFNATPFQSRYISLSLHLVSLAGAHQPTKRIADPNNAFQFVHDDKWKPLKWWGRAWRFSELTRLPDGETGELAGWLWPVDVERFD